MAGKASSCIAVNIGEGKRIRKGGAPRTPMNLSSARHMPAAERYSGTCQSGGWQRIRSPVWPPSLGGNTGIGMARRSNRDAARSRYRPARPLREKRGCWTSYRHDGRTALGAGIQHDQDDQDLPAALLHLVERHHVRHPIVDLGLWRIGRDRRVRQSLLTNPRRQDRPDAPVRAPLGGLQRLCGGLEGAAELAWLAASHRRRAADPGECEDLALGEAASAESHRHAAGLSPARLDACPEPPPPRDRRL